MSLPSKSSRRGFQETIRCATLGNATIMTDVVRRQRSNIEPLHTVQIVTAEVVPVDIGSRNCALEQREVDVKGARSVVQEEPRRCTVPRGGALSSRYQDVIKKASVAGGMWHQRSQTLQHNSVRSEKTFLWRVSCLDPPLCLA